MSLPLQPKVISFVHTAVPSKLQAPDQALFPFCCNQCGCNFASCRLPLMLYHEHFSCLHNLDVTSFMIPLWYWYVIRDLGPLLPRTFPHTVLCPGCTHLERAYCVRTPTQSWTMPQEGWLGERAWFLFHPSLLLQFYFLTPKKTYLELHEEWGYISISCPLWDQGTDLHIATHNKGMMVVTCPQISVTLNSQKKAFWEERTTWWEGTELWTNTECWKRLEHRVCN